MLNFLKKIPTPLYLTLIIVVVMLNIDVIMKTSQEHVKSVAEEDKISTLATSCDRTSFDITFQRGQTIQDCRKLASLTKNSNQELYNKVINNLCKLEELSACFTLASNMTNKSGQRYKELLIKSCNSGGGGIMKACGELGLLIKDNNPSKASEYLNYACKAGNDEYCNL